MSAENESRTGLKSLLEKYPVAAYFALTLAISWIGAFAVAAPALFHREPLPKITGILMFPAMLLGPSFAGVLLTGIVDGREGLKNLASRLFTVRLAARWYTPLIIPPLLVLAVLLLLQTLVSPLYEPNRFWLGILFGIPAGLLEEIGWTGYVYPKMRPHDNRLAAAILLGVLWGVWHLPVVNYLGTATPHGAYWLPFLCAFTFAMTAMRVLICWLYTNTGSVFLTQLMHISSTGALVVFSASRVSAAQEVVWYSLYGVTLWVVVAGVVKVAGKGLRRADLHRVSPSSSP